MTRNTLYTVLTLTWIAILAATILFTALAD